MHKLRKHGEPPYSIAVVHGGPGARGEMAPVAHELAADWGILETLQTATTLEGQVQELAVVLEKNGEPPLALVGYSWGAWLSTLVAARYANLVGRLILVGSGPFDDRYVAAIQETRLSRLNEPEKTEYRSILQLLSEPGAQGQDAAFARLGLLTCRTDSFDPIEEVARPPEPALDLLNPYHPVLTQAQQMRSSGALLAEASRIRCPVVAIHGDHDPHPAAGVQEPLCAALESFRLILLRRCGHKPWIERQARDKFFHVLREELRRGDGQAGSQR